MVTSAVLSPYVRQSRRLFSAASDRFDKVRTNPVTGYRWLNGVDSISKQIRAAARALMAQAEVAKLTPAYVPQLPTSYAAREALKTGGVNHIFAWFARSLEACNYDLGIHPLFEPYARGVLASPYTAYFISQDQTLQQLFPARELKGLGSGLYWQPSLVPIRSGSPWQQRLFLSSPPPPQSCANAIPVDRQDANVSRWYAPNSKAFLQLDDEFIAHATKLAPYKRLPTGWMVHKPMEVFTRNLRGYQLWVVKSDYGWLVERQQWGGNEEVLANIFMDFPVLCDTYVMAARLAEAVLAGLSTQYQLTWISTI